jgi:hypothetical protein
MTQLDCGCAPDLTRPDEPTAKAAALVETLGAERLAWLDAFLDDYVFQGEPLDRVLVKARDLARLPRRPARSALDD